MLDVGVPGIVFFGVVVFVAAVQISWNATNALFEFFGIALILFLLVALFLSGMVDFGVVLGLY